ncbi:hypothetical protein [Pseudomonas laurylsulfatiphila]|jgi:hypothetical protein
MSFRTLTDSRRHSSHCEVAALQPMVNPDAVGMAYAGNDDSIEHVLDSARHWAHSTDWVFYRAGEQMHWVGQGDPQAQWPSSIANEAFAPRLRQ